MSIEKVKKFFSEYGIEDRIIELSESSATVELAAAALGCEPKRIAKSLSFSLDGARYSWSLRETRRSITQNTRQPSARRRKCSPPTR